MKKLTLLGSIGLALALAAFAGAAQRGRHFDGHRNYGDYHSYGGYHHYGGFDRSYVHIGVGPEYYAPQYVPAPYAYEPAPYYYDDEPAPYYYDDGPVYDDEPSVSFGFGLGGAFGGRGGEHYGGSHFRGGGGHFGGGHFGGGHAGGGGHRGGGHNRF